MKSNIINNYGRLQHLSLTRFGKAPYIILEIGMIKTDHYKLNKNWCRWYYDIENKRYYFNGKLLNITRPNYAKPGEMDCFKIGEYVLQVKCKPNNYLRFVNKLLFHKEIELLVGGYNDD